MLIKLLTLFFFVAFGRIITIDNNVSRVDEDGNILDSHSGIIVEVNGTYYLYGERYGNTTGLVNTWASQDAPRLGVYTSKDLQSWTDHGYMLNDTNSTGWLPYVFYDDTTNRFICWYGIGDWGVAISYDGINFYHPSGIPYHQTSRLGGQTDGNMVYIDDDINKTGYIIFSGLVDYPQNESASHRVSIEILTKDYLSSTKVNITGFFPDDFVECPMLFKRKDVYYVTYGSCCCACRVGSGLVVFKSKSIDGPWIKQTNVSDINCNNKNVSICRSGFTIPAQGYYIAKIQTLNDTEPVLMWMANRWLQADGNNPECQDLCHNNDQCSVSNQPQYRVGKDPTYWAPLEFDEYGNILPMRWIDSFTLDIPQ